MMLCDIIVCQKQDETEPRALSLLSQIPSSAATSDSQILK